MEDFIQYAIENPYVAPAAATAASTATYAVVGWFSKQKGVAEARDIDSRSELVEEKDRLEGELEDESWIKGVLNHVKHPVKSGKMGGYEEEISRRKRENGESLGYWDSKDEYHNQIFSDEQLEDS
jgi:hypothetical protein